MLDRHGLACSGVGAAMLGERSLTSADAETRRSTLAYLERALRFAHAVGGPVLTVVPATIGRTEPADERTREWRRCVDGLRALVELAAPLGVRVAVEPLARTETYLVRRVAEALELAEATGCGVCVDVYQSSFEEADVPAALRECGDRLAEVHLADSGRLPPGEGSVDWRAVIAALDDAGYDGYLTLEYVLPEGTDAAERRRRLAAATAAARAS